jgi:sulfate transport system permease protein
VVGLVLIPILAVCRASVGDGLWGFWEAISDPGAVDALKVSLLTGGITAVVNAFVGTGIAWWLVRWDLPGRNLLAALVDLPLAIPTLVVGILLVALYGPQTPVGQALGGLGIRVAYARPGMILALLFVTLPFVVRTVQPVLEELDPAEEEAAWTLGASELTTFWRVLLPPQVPAIVAGAVQTFARSIAEFGSIAAVSGNIPHRTLAAPVFVLGEIEAGNTHSAAAVSVVLLVVALALHPLASSCARRLGGRHG